MIKIASVWPVAACAVLATACERNRANEAFEEAREETREPQTVAEPPPAGKMAPGKDPAAANAPKAEGEKEAEADLRAAEGEEIEGEVEFYATGAGVRIVAEIEDAKPGKHGIHVHQKGDCSDIKGKSMGDHFAPDSKDHALPSEGMARHLGDLGNIEVDADGKGRLEVTIEKANLKPNDAMSFLGKALVIHMGEDSGKAMQPSGGSGVPIACGVIEKS
jgi:Cu-Zn family superoxide dismutase